MCIEEQNQASWPNSDRLGGMFHEEAMVTSQPQGEGYRSRPGQPHAARIAEQKL